MEIIIVAILVICIFLLISGVFGMLRGGSEKERRHVRTRLANLSRSTKTSGVDIQKKTELSSLPWLHKRLASLSWVSKLETVRHQAGVQVNVGVLILLALILCLGSFQAVRLFTDNVFLTFPTAMTFGYAPIFWLLRRRNKLMAKFQRQLPEALDLMARALKAGHAFTQGMRMVADEFEAPIGPEFAATMEEINLGMSSEQALLNLANRVACPDLKFFVVSVNIQRETGGNLSEIVGNIATLIRERFKLYGKVQVLAAEGKLTAYILLALPASIGLVINIINPEYMSALHETEQGKTLLTMALIMMGLGAAALKKMIAIKV